MEFDALERDRLAVYLTFLQELYSPRERRKPPGIDFPFGIEEEFFLADASSFESAVTTSELLFTVANAATAGLVGREMLQSQAEVSTPPSVTPDEAAQELKYVRQTLAAVAADHRLSILASGTHPTAEWRKSQQSKSSRYDEVMADLQMIGKRNMLCGMHVHVELPDPDRRVEIMTRMIPYLPLFLALSTSSPFWCSSRTGLKGYRLAAYDELPRTGLPDAFSSKSDFDDYVDALVSSGAIKNSSYLWWMIRPSAKYPTLELRAPDSCTHVDDTIAIASLYRTLVRHLYRTSSGSEITAIDRALAAENKWRSQRDGVHATFATRGGAMPLITFLAELLDMIASDAEDLDCLTEVSHCMRIVKEGNSADAQLKVFDEASAVGSEHALRRVCEWIATATLDFDRTDL